MSSWKSAEGLTLSKARVARSSPVKTIVLVPEVKSGESI